jgi:hypothetical protein
MVELIARTTEAASERDWMERRARELFALHQNSDIDIELDDYGIQSLVCPFCGESDLHQSDVQVIWRKECQSNGLRIESHQDETFTADHNASQAKGYRDAMEITFWCEHCDTKPKLHIYQHKGKTYIAWDNDSVIDKSML